MQTHPCTGNSFKRNPFYQQQRSQGASVTVLSRTSPHHREIGWDNPHRPGRELRHRETGPQTSRAGIEPWSSKCQSTIVTTRPSFISGCVTLNPLRKQFPSLISASLALGKFTLVSGMTVSLFSHPPAAMLDLERRRGCTFPLHTGAYVVPQRSSWGCFTAAFHVSRATKNSL